MVKSNYTDIYLENLKYKVSISITYYVLSCMCVHVQIKNKELFTREGTYVHISTYV